MTHSKEMIEFICESTIKANKEYKSNRMMEYGFSIRHLYIQYDLIKEYLIELEIKTVAVEIEIYNDMLAIAQDKKEIPAELSEIAHKILKLLKAKKWN